MSWLCLPGQLWVLGLRSTNYKRVLFRCLYSRWCVRSWRSRGWPLSWPEAARLPLPSSLPPMAGLPGGTRAFPRWRECSRCTCACGTPPLGGIIRVSCPKPVSWRLCLWPKLIVLRARQLLPCMPWLPCRFAKALKQMHEGNSDPGL